MSRLQSNDLVGPNSGISQPPLNSSILISEGSKLKQPPTLLFPVIIAIFVTCLVAILIALLVCCLAKRR